MEIEEEEPKGHTPNKDINFAMCTDDIKLKRIGGDVARNQRDEAIIKGYLNMGLLFGYPLYRFILIPLFTRKKN